MSFDLAICNGIIITPNNCYAPLIGSIGIRNGVIEYVGEKKIFPRETKAVIDAYGKIVMPGLVNGHCHGDMTLARGMGDDLTLQEQSELFGDSNWFFNFTTEEDRYYSRLLTYIEAILSGTTFILDNTFWSLGAKSTQAMKSVGIKGGIVEDVCVDFATPDEMKLVAELTDFKHECTRNQILPVLGGILEESYTKTNLSKMSEVANQLDCLVTSHLCETEWRKQSVENKFHTSSVQLLRQHRILNEKYIGSHAIYLSKEDIQILNECNAKIVNTPLCEMKIADGVAPIPELLKNGVVVGLGTDGAMWNNSNDIFREMKGMALLQTITKGIRSLSSHSILNMATIDGAKVFGLENEIGSLEEGKRADIILVDADQPHIAPLRIKNHENVSSALVYCATGRDVTDVIIDGNHLVENRRLLTIDVSEVIEKVTSISEKIGLYQSGGDRFH